MKRRAAIAMSEAEIAAFLDEQRTLTCATIGPDAWPHLMPLWYVVRDGEIWAWTYGKSQKVRNLERESRCTIQVEAGASYGELRGVMMKCVCAIHRDPEVVAGVGTELGIRYGSGGYAVTPPQAAKRVALQFIVSQTASWDHRKL
jgi:pyridoxamine 5'-phosphate oxidase-like protein